MPKNEIGEFDETDSGNTDISGIGLSDATLIDQLDNIARAQMGALKRWFKSSLFRLRDSTDQTKLLAFDLSGLTTATTRTVTMGDANVTLRPQGWEKIADYSPSALSSIDVTGLSAYTRLRISGYMLPATDDVYAFARVSVDNGSNFLQGASDYSYQRIFSSGGTLTSDVANDTHLPLGTVNVGNAAGEGIDFSIEISSFNKARAALGRGNSTHKNAAGTVSIGTLGTWCNGTTARDAIRIAFSSGNIASGFVTIEGWRG